MIAKAIERLPHRAGKQHALFFRQSGWLVMATITGGVLSMGVHFLSKRVSEAQYSIFGLMLMVAIFLPTLPLQMVFAKQTASAVATGRERQLASMLRQTWFWISALWLVLAAVVLAYQGDIMRLWKLTDPMAIWVTMVTVLLTLWLPMFLGVLQGRQNFFWMGWIAILSAVLRLVVAVVLVLAWSASATSMMAGAMLGVAVAIGICIWQTSDFWRLLGEHFDGRGLLRQVVPMAFGFGACQFMFTYDTIIAMLYFPGNAMAPYVAAGTLSRALLWLVLPLATVMFPKIVHSTIKAEKTNLLGVVLIGTAALAICAALGLCLVGPWVVRWVFTPQYVSHTIALLPWYVGAILPLTLANVLINDLLARSRFRVVVPMVVLTVAYALTLPYVLGHVSRQLETVLQVLGVFNLLLLAVASWAAFGHARSKVRGVPSLVQS